jgi:hypothetical protein
MSVMYYLILRIAFMNTNLAARRSRLSNESFFSVTASRVQFEVHSHKAALSFDNWQQFHLLFE